MSIDCCDERGDVGEATDVSFYHESVGPGLSLAGVVESANAV